MPAADAAWTVARAPLSMASVVVISLATCGVYLAAFVFHLVVAYVNFVKQGRRRRAASTAAALASSLEDEDDQAGLSDVDAPAEGDAVAEGGDADGGEDDIADFDEVKAVKTLSDLEPTSTQVEVGADFDKNFEDVDFDDFESASSPQEPSQALVECETAKAKTLPDETPAAAEDTSAKTLSSETLNPENPVEGKDADIPPPLNPEEWVDEDVASTSDGEGEVAVHRIGEVCPQEEENESQEEKVTSDDESEQSVSSAEIRSEEMDDTSKLEISTEEEKKEDVSAGIVHISGAEEVVEETRDEEDGSAHTLTVCEEEGDDEEDVTESDGDEDVTGGDDDEDVSDGDDEEDVAGGDLARSLEDSAENVLLRTPLVTRHRRLTEEFDDASEDEILEEDYVEQIDSALKIIERLKRELTDHSADVSRSNSPALAPLADAAAGTHTTPTRHTPLVARRGSDFALFTSPLLFNFPRRRGSRSGSSTPSPPDADEFTCPPAAAVLTPKRSRRGSAVRASTLPRRGSGSKPVRRRPSTISKATQILDPFSSASLRSRPSITSLSFSDALPESEQSVTVPTTDADAALSDEIHPEGSVACRDRANTFSGDLSPSSSQVADLSVGEENPHVEQFQPSASSTALPEDTSMKLDGDDESPADDLEESQRECSEKFAIGQQTSPIAANSAPRGTDSDVDPLDVVDSDIDADSDIDTDADAYKSDGPDVYCSSDDADSDADGDSFDDADDALDDADDPALSLIARLKREISVHKQDQSSMFQSMLHLPPSTGLASAPMPTLFGATRPAGRSAAGPMTMTPARRAAFLGGRPRSRHKRTNSL